MKMTKKHLARTPLLVRVVFVYAGIIMASWGIHTFDFDFSAPQIAAPANAHVRTEVAHLGTTEDTTRHTPVVLQIDAIRLDVDIRPGTYNAKSDTWTLSNDAVYFATMTSRPNYKSGTTLLYGHNTWGIFEKTAMLEQGDIAIITTSDERQFHYRYVKNTSVLPSNTAILGEEAEEPRLVLMTCEGWQNERRKLHYFEIVPESESAS